MASLFAADLSGMTDGRIRCPVTVVAGSGDPLFPLTYTRQVYDRIVAPGKELSSSTPTRTCCSTRTSTPSSRRCWPG